MRSAAAQFTVPEGAAVTVVSANQFALPGCDPYTYLMGNIVGLEQSGAVRPATVVDCKYDSPNARTLVSVTGRLDPARPLRVWKQDGSDAAYMMNGCAASPLMYLPGGMAAGAAAFDAALSDMGMLNPTGRVLKNSGAVTYSADTTWLGGYPLKFQAQGLAQDAPGGAGAGSNGYRRGIFTRMSLKVTALGEVGVFLYLRNYNGSYDFGFVRLNTNGTVSVMEYAQGGGGYIINATSSWTVPINGTWFDFAYEADPSGIRGYRFWVNGAPQASLTGSNFSWLGCAFCLGTNALTFDSVNGTFSASTQPSNPTFYVHDYLMLGYAPVLANGVTLPVPAKPFSYHGLRTAY